MQEIIRINRRKGLYRATGLSSFSTALLQVDLRKDVSALLLDLLRCIYADWLALLNHRNPSDVQTSTDTLHHLVIARLNVLVLISKRVWLYLTDRNELRPLVIGGIFHVLRLVLWSANRSIRCATLRCLRYYLRSAEDVRLFLAFRMDLLVARSLDLSYLPETQSCCGPSEQSRFPPTRPIRLQPSQSLSRQRRTDCISPSNDKAPAPSANSTFTPNQSDPTSQGHLPSSPLVSNLGERQQFLRLAYHVLRLAPHLYPTSLVAALAAPCLRASRIHTIGLPTQLNRDAKVQRFRHVESSEHTMGEVDYAREDFQLRITGDSALRACMMMLCELVMRCFQVTSCNQLSRDQEILLNTIIVPTLLTTFGYKSKNTIYPLRIHHTVCTALLTLINQDSTSALIPARRIAKFFVPFTSSTTVSDLDSSQRQLQFDNYPSFITSCKLCLVKMLRSWSGLFYFLHEGLSSLQTLMYSLAVGSTEMRDHILDLLYALFPTLPTPRPVLTDVEPAIIGLTESLLTGSPVIPPVLGSKHNTWSYLDDGFVAAEGCRVFSAYPANCGVPMDLVNAYTALLLTALIQAGVYEGLVRAIADSDRHTSVRAGLLFGWLAYKAGLLLPQEHPASRRLHDMGLLESGLSESQTAVVWLERVNRAMRTHHMSFGLSGLIHAPSHSPFLECLVRQATMPASSPSVTEEENPEKFQLSETWINQIVQQSGVLTIASGKQHPPLASGRPTHQRPASPSDPEHWDWDLLAAFGRSLFDVDSMISWEDKARISFLQRLMDFFTPTHDIPLRRPSDTIHLQPPTVRPSNASLVSTNRTSESRLTRASSKQSNTSLLPPLELPTRPLVNLAWLPSSWPHAASAAILCAGLVSHLVLYPTASEPGRLLTRFISVIGDALQTLHTPRENPANTIRLFEAQQLTTSCSPMVLSALGRLTSTDVGESHLETNGLCSVLHRLFLHTDADSTMNILSKVLLSSLDFRRPGRLGFHLLNAAVICPRKPVRLYCVQFIRLLFRLQVPLLVSWCMELVVKLCMDNDQAVSRDALELLEELSWNQVNVEALTRFVFCAPLPSSINKQMSSRLFTPFGLHLLDQTRSGPVGHRILACALARLTSFEPVTPTLGNTVKDSCPVDSNPINFLIEVSRKIHNVKYAQEVDQKLSAALEGVDADFANLVDNSDDVFHGHRAEREFFVRSVFLESNTCYLGDPLPYYITVPSHSLRILLPKHVYGCLANNPTGFTLLRESGALQNAVNTLNLYLADCHSMKPICAKACLWCLAHVGTSQYGRSWISEQPELVEKFYETAVNAPDLGVRAVAWLSLNLLMSPTDAAEIFSNSRPQDATQWVTGCLFSVQNNVDELVGDQRALRISLTQLGDVDEIDRNAVDGPLFNAPNGIGTMKATSKDPKIRGVRHLARNSARRFFSRTKHTATRGLSSTIGEAESADNSSPTDTGATNRPLRKSRLQIFGSSSGELERASRIDLQFAQLNDLDQSSITWTHRDLITSRRILLDLASKPSPTHTTNGLPISSHVPSSNLRTIVYLPADVRVLGHRSTSASSGANPCVSHMSDHKSKTLLAFVDVAHNAEMLLDHCTGNSDSENSMPKKLVATTPQSLSPPEVAPVTKEPVQLKSCDMLICARGDSHAQSSCCDFHCLSRNCDSPNHRKKVPWIRPNDEVDSKRSNVFWANQLFDAITALSLHVSSTRSDQLLGKLVRRAHDDPSIFNACVYTEVSKLLAIHSLPLEVRTKIQSILSTLDLPELLSDAEHALSQLEKGFSHLS